MHVLRIITYILVIIGALNWGLVGLFNINLVTMLFGEMTMAARIIYSLIGISAIIYMLLSFRDI